MTPFESALYRSTYGPAFAANPSAAAAHKIAARAVDGFRALVAGKGGPLLMPVAEGNVPLPPVDPEDPDS